MNADFLERFMTCLSDCPATRVVALPLALPVEQQRAASGVLGWGWPLEPRSTRRCGCCRGSDLPGVDVGRCVGVGSDLDDGVADAALSFAVDEACLQLARGVSPATGQVRVDDACGCGGGCERPDKTRRGCKVKLIRLGAQPKVSSTVTKGQRSANRHNFHLLTN